jgi:hypothetical protein
MVDFRANEHIVGDVPIASVLSASAHKANDPTAGPPTTYSSAAGWCWRLEMLDPLVLALTLHRGSGR